MAKGKNVLTTGDVAKICNVAPRTVSKWFDNGQLKGYRIPGSKDRRIPLGELIRFMKIHNMPIDALGIGRIRIVLADSSPDASTLADTLQQKSNYDVQMVGSNFEAGAVIQRFSPHVLIINLLSEGIDASSICESVRADEDLRTVKIIALANHLSDSESTALLQQGYDGCIKDAADTTEIVKSIEEATAIIY